MTEPIFKPRQKVWISRLNQQNQWNAVEGVIFRIAAESTDSMVFVRVSKSGGDDTIVLECEPREIFHSRKDALVACIRLTQKKAAAALAHADLLLQQLSVL